MNTREIVSLQFGHYSNFIGTHWWNLQETSFDYTGQISSDINHDVLFREGLTNKGATTFTPRLLLVDLKGSLKTLSAEGDLYNSIANPETSTVLWPDDEVEVRSEEKPSKNVFQKYLDNPDAAKQTPIDLNNDVKVWSDFLYGRFHPRTVNIIKEYQHDDTNSPYDVFPLGKQTWQAPEFNEIFCDKIRNYIEECDNTQGFHVTVDCFNSFGGITSSCLEYLTDEYQKSILTFMTIPNYYSNDSDEMNASIRTINIALCSEALAEFSSLTIPLSTGCDGWRHPGSSRHFQHTTYKPDLHYHTSAILASALDTFTIPYRLKSTNFCLGDFCRDLTTYGRKMAAASLNLPFSLDTNVDLIDYLDNLDGSLWQTLTPNCNLGSDKLMQIVTARGILETRLKRPVHEAGKQREMPAYRCETVQEMLNFYLDCTTYASANHVTAIKDPLSIRTPFPNLFDQSIGGQSVSAIAGCHVGGEVGNMLQNLHRDASKIKIAQFHQFRSAGLESDDYREILDRLLDLRECYEDTSF